MRAKNAHFVPPGTRGRVSGRTSRLDGNYFEFVTIGDEPPLGLTGSGLIKIVNELLRVGVIEESGRITDEAKQFAIERVNGVKRIYLTSDKNIWLTTQKDVRELQKAKGAIRAAIEILMVHLKIMPDDLKKVILTGSFGGQLDIASVISLGMIPDVSLEIIENTPNGAGLGAAIFLTDKGFLLGNKLARQSVQVELDQASEFQQMFVKALQFSTK